MLENLISESYESMQLYRKHLCSKFLVSDHMIAAAPNLELVYRDAIEFMAKELTTILTCNGTKCVNSEYCEVPADWWQYFKQRWFPWIKIKTKQIEITKEYWNMCPHMVLDNRQERHLVWLNRSSVSS